MTQFWVRPTGNADQVAGAALEAGADGVIAGDDQLDDVESVGRVPTATIDGDEVTLGDRIARRVRVDDPEDQQQAKKLVGQVDALIVETSDWSIIPLENLIAWAQDEDTDLLALVETAEEAEIALTTLETGTDGIVLATDDAATVHATASLVTAEAGTVDLVTGTVTRVEPAGMGDRVCVDTTSLLDPEEGLLVGSRSAFMALVASEASEAGYVASRPFRVNAGAVHGYVMAPNDETHYLSEVQAGTRLVAVTRDGSTRPVTTGRAKIERRPMLIVEIEADEADGTLVLQNAETIRLVTPEGLVSVADLEPGDEVLVHPAHAGGRHFGEAIEETVREV